MQYPLKKKFVLIAYLILTVIENTKSHFPNCPQNLVLGIAVLEKCAKIKTKHLLERRNKAFSLF